MSNYAELVEVFQQLIAAHPRERKLILSAVGEAAELIEEFVDTTNPLITALTQRVVISGVTEESLRAFFAPSEASPASEPTQEVTSI